MGHFPRELDKAWVARRRELGRELSEEEGQRVEVELFEHWVAAVRFDELIRRVHSVFDVEGGTHELAVLGYALRQKKDAQRIHALFQGLISRRRKAFWESWPQASAGHVGQMVLAAQRLAAAMEVYLEYFHSLSSLGLEAEAGQLREEMRKLQMREK
jgi:hypothetical protein